MFLSRGLRQFYFLGSSGGRPTWVHWRGTGQAFRSRSLFFAYLIAAVERCRCNAAAYPRLSKGNFQEGYPFFESCAGVWRFSKRGCLRFFRDSLNSHEILISDGLTGLFV